MSRKKIGIIDYGVGNLRSVYYAIERVGGMPELVSTKDALRRHDALVLPGVGAFPHTAQALSSSGLRIPVIERAAEGATLLGICVGMQLLFEESHEFGVTPGLGLLAGSVQRINVEERLPVIGWFRTSELATSRRGYYFLHSFAAKPSDPTDVFQTYQYGDAEITASVVRGNIMGTQYHPERSASDGLAVLASFVEQGTIAPK